MATSFFFNNCDDEAEQIESAKNYADLARDWAIKLDGQVEGIDFSAKYWALQAAEGTGIKITVKSDGTPLGEEFTVFDFDANFTLTQIATNEVLVSVDPGVLGVTLLQDGIPIG
jgi:hypothetical protein